MGERCTQCGKEKQDILVHAKVPDSNFANGTVMKEMLLCRKCFLDVLQPSTDS